MIKFFVASFCLSAALWLPLDAQIITTIAGGSSTTLGDGGPAVNCGLNSPYSTAIDGFGNVYIADVYNNRVRKIKNDGTIITIAGNGIGGFSGDGGAATNAEINSPTGVAVDLTGNVYFSDNANARIRKIDLSGIITTIGGSDSAGYSGDNGPATNAQLYSPHGIAISSTGDIYICEPLNDCIRKINPAGIITTIAGNHTAGYSGDGGPATAAQLSRPFCVTTDLSGNIYFTEWNNNCVRKINAMGIISTIAGGNPTLGFGGDNGPATAADFYVPIGIAIDLAGNIFIADSYNNRVRKINTSGIIATYAGNGTAGYSGDGAAANMAELFEPVGASVDKKGNLYIAEYVNNTIRYVTNVLSAPGMGVDRESISCYPNPCSGIFYVTNNSTTGEPVHVAVTDIFGNILTEIDVQANTSNRVTLASTGCYFVHCFSPTNTIVEKIINVQ